MMARHFTGSTERHWLDADAIAADRHHGREHGFCTLCGEPFCMSRKAGAVQHAEFADLCESCGDVVGEWQDER